VVQRQQLQFLTERFYNNPRPFYGFEQTGAVWARVISAPANVLGRMSHLLDIYERQISGERRSNFHEGIGEYLKLYYAGRDKLPPDETNGNTPLVSRHEVAWYAWSNTHDGRMGDLIASGEIENMVDLCYQTQALAEIDPSGIAVRFRKTPSGSSRCSVRTGSGRCGSARNNRRWSFRPGTRSGHSKRLACRHRIRRWPKPSTICFAVSRRSAGGWTRSSRSRISARRFAKPKWPCWRSARTSQPVRAAKGWGAAAPARLSSDPVEVLQQLDAIWDPVTDGMRAQIRRPRHRLTR
jgi:hypothetical protein